MNTIVGGESKVDAEAVGQQAVRAEIDEQAREKSADAEGRAGLQSVVRNPGERVGKYDPREGRIPSVPNDGVDPTTEHSREAVQVKVGVRRGRI